MKNTLAFAALLLGYVLGVVVQLPLLVTQQVLLFRGLAGGEPMDAQAVMARLGWLAVPSQMLATLVQMGVKLYAAFGMTLLYFDVRRRREGDDLQEAIARLAGAAPGFIPPGGQAPKDPAS